LLKGEGSNVSRTTEKVAFILFVILLTLVFSKNAYGQFPLNVTVTTDKELYDIMEPILVTGNLTLSGAPVSNGLVAIQVDNPENNLFAIRTRPTGTAPTGEWSVEILEVIPCDQGGNPKDSFRPGENVRFKVTIKNNDPLAHTVTVTLNVYDQREAPFAALIVYAGSIDAKDSITMTSTSIPIPDMAPKGNATVYANVLTKLPKDGGFAYSPEKTETFTINGSTSTTASTTRTTQSASEEGTYNLTFKIGSKYGAKLGNYMVYLCSSYEIWIVTNSTTFEAMLIGDITGPEGVPDGLVDIDDVMFIALRYGSYPGHDVGLGWDPRADLTGPDYLVPDGIIDIDDVMIPALAYGVYV